ncbi:MAG: 16S rRNA (adenine(1518)-N(6)/adenine(1519)-N(6))-dimethyltransferase RsmA [Candidatus Phytoplasma stylosanthis]|nr:16S rRNA (adenine(1518)-N(6)/adenine(1519)-N(6))-dimethyltransferase RsmA [Candidatus Phytoplasma stylosanthis]
MNLIIKETNLKRKNVVEIGPGKGILTRLILDKAKKVLAYEIDSDLKSFLNFDSNLPIDIIYDDFLLRDLEKDLEKYFKEEEVILVGNLPYNIAVPILLKVLFTKKIKTFTIMIQKELGLRILSKSKSKNYNSLSVFVQSLTKITKIKIVKKGMYFPKPKVDGIILKFDKLFLDKKEQKFIETDFYQFIRFSFKQKRKKLINNLSKNFEIKKKEVMCFFKKNKIPLNIRAEEINIEQFKKISYLFLNFFSLFKKVCIL